MTRWHIFAAALACSFACLALPLRAQVVEQNGDWVLVCTEEADCTIIGAPNPGVLPGYPRVEMRFRRGAEAGAVLRASTFLADAQGEAHPDAHTLDLLSLSVGPMTAPVHPLQVDGAVTGPQNFDYFSEAESIAMAEAIADDSPAYVRSGFGAFAAMPVGDLRALLRTMDRVQAAAQEARSGEEPDAFTSGAPVYELFPRDEVELPSLPARLTRPCRHAPEMEANGYALDHTTVPTLLVLVQCGGRDRAYLWYPSGGGEPERLQLERERQRGARQTQASFDTDGGILTLLDHPDGRTDCGVRTRWGWVDGEGFVLLSSARMPICRAIRPETWPETFTLQGWIVR